MDEPSTTPIPVDKKNVKQPPLPFDDTQASITSIEKQIGRKLLNSDYPSHSYPITMREAQRIGLKVSSLEPKVNDLLLDLNALYSEMAQKALTDFNEYNYHDNEIINIHETKGIQIYFQNDKDWNCIQAERRWQTLNNESSWRMTRRVKGKKVPSILHIR